MLDLSRERWKLVDDHFVAALERDPDERTAYLRATCGNDPALYAAVTALLEHVALSEDDFGESAASYVAPFLGDLLSEGASIELEEGALVGPYRIVSELGRGGMGTVYLAERADGTFEKKVALKLVQRGVGNDAVANARFQRERQILAGLDHSGIARLLDAGTAQDARPFLVMEFVDGEPITAYADRKKLGVEARIDLVRQAAEAVAYAHRRLIIHRDLKPNNILVAETEAGAPRVKLLDFGIARLLGVDVDVETEDEAAALSPTLRFTPVYAAPEQLRGEAITTATDVYALGVLMYELLAGQRPFDLDGKVLAEIVHVVTSEDPVAPSSVVMDERRARRLRNDLDAIILKALAREPDTRYRSVEALLNDLQRHEDGLPVEARSGGTGYRVRKFVGRHRAAVLTSALMVLLLAGSLGLALWQAKEKAEEAERADAVKTLVLDLFQQANPDVAQGDVLTAIDLVAQGAARVRETLADQPDVQAEMLVVLAEVYQKLAEYDEALPLLEDALALRTGLYGGEHERTAEVLDRLGVLQMDRAEYDLADSLLMEALRIRRVRLGSEHNDVAETLYNLGALRGAGRQGRVEEAAELHRQSLEIRERILDEDDPDLLHSIRGLAVVLQNQGEFEAAEHLVRDLLQRMRRVHGERHPETIRAMNSLSIVLTDLMKFDEAVTVGRDAVDLSKRVFGEEHPATATALDNLAHALTNRGRIGRHAEVEALRLEVLAIQRATLSPDHPEIGNTLASLGILYIGLERFEDAIAVAREALGLHIQKLGEEHRNIVVDKLFLAKALYGSDATDEAEQLFSEAYDTALNTWPTDHLIVGDILVHHGQLLQEQGRTRDAEPMLREGLRIAEPHLPPTHDLLGAAKLRIGLCLVARNQFEEAELLFLDALAIYGESSPEEGVPLVREALVDLYTALGRADEAQAFR